MLGAQPPLQALVTGVPPLTRPAAATLAAFPRLQHITVVSKQPLHLLFSFPGVHFSLLFMGQPLPPLVRSLLGCHLERQTSGVILSEEVPPARFPPIVTLLIPSKHLSPSAVI